MGGLKWTALRHRMLRAVTAGVIVLECKNVKQAYWRPRSDEKNHGQFNLSAGESRAVSDLLRDYAHTPHWQGDTGVRRVVEPTTVGRALLAEWDEQHPKGE